MNNFTLLESQYKSVMDMRETLLSYCESVSEDDFVKELDIFSGGSIRKLLVHNGNVYRHWIGNFALQKKIKLIEDKDVNSFVKVREIYAYADSLVFEFLEKFKEKLNSPFMSVIPFRNVEYTTTPLKVFTHVITHEFHHKGQILSISRNLGYTPIDTDIIRF